MDKFNFPEWSWVIEYFQAFRRSKFRAKTGAYEIFTFCSDTKLSDILNKEFGLRLQVLYVCFEC